MVGSETKSHAIRIAADSDLGKVGGMNSGILGTASEGKRNCANKHTHRSKDGRSEAGGGARSSRGTRGS